MIKNEFLVQLGANVKKTRKAKGITVRKLGEMCNADYANLSRFENGQKNIGILHLKNLADKLEVEIKDLL